MKSCGMREVGLLVSGLAVSAAFIGTPVSPPGRVFPGADQRCCVSRGTRLHSSRPDLPSEDELSKLLGKRSSIKKSTEEKKEAAAAAAEVEIDLNLDDFNWDAMPELKTSRPVRRSSDQTAKKESANKDKAEEEKAAVIDFKADYEDENDLHVPNRLAWTTERWGDKAKGFKEGTKLKKKEVREGKFLAGDMQAAYNALTQAGLPFLFTSEAHGAASRKSNLSAEHVIARCSEEATQDSMDPIIASTLANPWLSLLKGSAKLRYGAQGVVSALEASCERMDQTGIELYQIGGTNTFYPGGSGALASGMAKAVDLGLCNYVGVCNYSGRKMKSFSRKLEKRGVQLTSNQFDFSLTNRKALKSGLISSCKALGVIPFASNPFDGGLATGTYTSSNPSGSEADGRFKYPLKVLDKWAELHTAQEALAVRVKTRVERESLEERDFRGYRGPPPKINTDITTTQIAINYIVAKGCVPVVSVTTPKQAEELVGCMGWSLTDEEVQTLDNAADLCEMNG